MKKSLLALAVAAALPAFAQAQTNITVTGSLDVSVESVNKDANGGQVSDIRVTNGVWSGSRLAFVGSEDIGGGLRGIFNFEHRFSPDTGTQTNAAVANNAVTGQFWAGQSWVGLAGGFGELKLGRQYSPIFRAIIGADLTGYSWYNNSVGLAGTAIRLANEVEYLSPSLGGFRLLGAYAAGENTANNKIGDVLGLAATGNFGPIGLGLGYHDIKEAQGTGTGSRKELAFGLSGKFGPAGVGLSYAEAKPAAGGKNKGLFLNTSFAFGAGTIYLTLKREDPQGDANTNDGVGLTYSHGLSKRTFVYGALGVNKQDRGTQPDLKPRAIAIGVRHFF